MVFRHSVLGYSLVSMAEMISCFSSSLSPCHDVISLTFRPHPTQMFPSRAHTLEQGLRVIVL